MTARTMLNIVPPDAIDAASVRRLDRFEIYRGRDFLYRQVWRWRYVMRNGTTIAASARGYVRRADCEGSLRIIASAFARGAPISVRD